MSDFVAGAANSAQRSAAFGDLQQALEARRTQVNENRAQARIDRQENAERAARVAESREQERIEQAELDRELARVNDRILEEQLREDDERAQRLDEERDARLLADQSARGQFFDAFA